MTERASVALVVNGIPRRLDVPPGWRLLDLLRDGLGLTGTKEGCDDGTCGTCIVLVDGRVVRACRTPATEAAGENVLTIEGLGSPERPHPLQQAFAAADAVQCGFCTPGMIMAAAALLERNPRPSRSEIVRWLGSNLCRCTGYNSIVDAIEWAANGRQGSPRRWPGRTARRAMRCPAARLRGTVTAPGGPGQGNRPRRVRGGPRDRRDAACRGPAEPARPRRDRAASIPAARSVCRASWPS